MTGREGGNDDEGKAEERRMAYNALMRYAPAFSIVCLLFAALTHAAAQTPAPNGVLNPVWSEAFRYLNRKKRNVRCSF